MFRYTYSADISPLRQSSISSGFLLTLTSTCTVTSSFTSMVMSLSLLVHLGFLDLSSLCRDDMKYRKSCWSMTDHLMISICLILLMKAYKDSRSEDEERAQIWMKSSVHLLSICCIRSSPWRVLRTEMKGLFKISRVSGKSCITCRSTSCLLNVWYINGIIPRLALSS